MRGLEGFSNRSDAVVLSPVSQAEWRSGGVRTRGGCGTAECPGRGAPVASGRGWKTQARRRETPAVGAGSAPRPGPGGGSGGSAPRCRAGAAEPGEAPRPLGRRSAARRPPLLAGLSLVTVVTNGGAPRSAVPPSCRGRAERSARGGPAAPGKRAGRCGAAALPAPRPAPQQPSPAEPAPQGTRDLCPRGPVPPAGRPLAPAAVPGQPRARPPGAGRRRLGAPRPLSLPHLPPCQGAGGPCRTGCPGPGGSAARPRGARSPSPARLAPGPASCACE